jgi:hypothetical protein
MAVAIGSHPQIASRKDMDVEDPLKTGTNKGGSETWFRRLFAYFLGAQKVRRRQNPWAIKIAIIIKVIKGRFPQGKL